MTKIGQNNPFFYSVSTTPSVCVAKTITDAIILCLLTAEFVHRQLAIGMYVLHELSLYLCKRRLLVYYLLH